MLVTAGLVVGISVAAAPVSGVSIEWVRVGLPGNADDVQTGFGSVPYAYRISKYEVTNAQYAEFLNAVAMSDPNGVYNPSMGTLRGGITRSGSSGTYQYSLISGREQMPVVYVSVYDAMRFANWMDNGQPSGAQDATTTEDGSYTITEQGIAENTIGRDAGARFLLPNRAEWYKAAYHDALGTQVTSYFDFPTGSNTGPTCSTPTGTPNHANCNNQVGDLTSVGSYTGSSSPWGAFDLAGNVWEWTEEVYFRDDRLREIRGASFVDGGGYLATFDLGIFPTDESIVGFRLAMIPEPGTGFLVALGMVGLSRLRHRREQPRQGDSGRSIETTK
jgi:formylglycine-generating enzyme required for sulfatase activity